MEFNVSSKFMACIIGSGVVVGVAAVGSVNLSRKRVLSELTTSSELLSTAAAKSLQKNVTKCQKLVKIV